MKREIIFKFIIVLIMGMVLFIGSINVFALEDPDSGFDFYEDTTGQLDTGIDTNTNPDTNTSTDTNTNVSPETDKNVTTNTTNNYDTNLPKAGVSENTFAGIAITVLAISAIYAYKKISEYKNI